MSVHLAATDSLSRLASAYQRLNLLQATDAQLQASAISESALAHLADHCPTSVQMFQGACKVYSQRPCFGFRLHENDAFRTLSYAEVWREVGHLASGLQRLKLAGLGEFVGICGFASVDWVMADFACLYSAATAVPLQTNLPQADFQSIVNNAGLTTVFCSIAQLTMLSAALAGCPCVKAVIIMDVGEEGLEPSLGAGLESMRRTHAVHTMPQVRAAGIKHGSVSMCIPGHGGVPADVILALIYTSGSTSVPKGAIYSEPIYAQNWRAPLSTEFPLIPYISLGYLPLNHVAGRNNVITSMIRGGTLFFPFKSDMSSLFQDLREVRPTALLLVPRVAHMIYQHYQTEVAKRQDKGAAEVVMQEMSRTFLGNRLTFALIGTAPTAPEVLDFLATCFGIPILDVYGATENGLVTVDRHLAARITAHKLVSVPELGYHNDDKPYPRGELRIKSTSVVPGYYKSAQASADLRDAEGYMCTGDIMEQRGPDVFVWLDRKSNIMKLAQGEFVSISKLETMYAAGCPTIAQIYVYAHSRRAYVLAVIVPNAVALEMQLGLDHESAAGKEVLRREIDALAHTQQLQGFETPRDFIVEFTPFSRENGLLTESNKLSRPRLKQAYSAALDALYERIESGQQSLTAASLQALRGAPVAEQVKRVLQGVLGVSDIDVQHGTQSFLQLGGDSVAAVQLCAHLEVVCAVPLSVAFVLNPGSTLASMVHEVSRLQREGQAKLSFAHIHGAQAKTMKASDMQLARFFNAADMKMARAAAPADHLPQVAQKILLTGANGYLGRFLLLELLERVPRDGGQVICLVRAANDAAALTRLRDGYGGGVAQSRFDGLMQAHPGRLQVVAGDLMQPRFGLSQDAYAGLSTSVDAVLHNGALVNHTFSYEQLFAPNVGGTVEVMRFAVCHKIKAIHFISSVAVAAGLPRRVSESEQAAQLWGSRPNEGGYAAGYGASKWACEILLQQLHEQLAVPLNIFRCGMILAHSRYLGQINTSDFFTRLLHSVVHTGIAPTSFYAAPHERDEHFDGLPVDFVAETIVAVSLAQHKDSAIYHVVNSHTHDGVSLDAFMDWVQTAGYDVTRIADYATWFARFRQELEAQDTTTRGHSALPLIHQWAHATSGRDATLFDAAQYRQKVRERTPWQDTPHLTEAFIHRCLAHMAHLGLIEPPEGRTRLPHSAWEPAIL